MCRAVADRQWDGDRENREDDMDFGCLFALRYCLAHNDASYVLLQDSQQCDSYPVSLTVALLQRAQAHILEH